MARNMTRLECKSEPKKFDLGHEPVVRTLELLTVSPVILATSIRCGVRAINYVSDNIIVMAGARVAVAL